MIVVPLVACLLALSVWPDAVSGHSFPAAAATPTVTRDPRRRDPHPHVDWLALSPSLALLGASGVALLGAVLVPAWLRHAVLRGDRRRGFVTAGVLAEWSTTASPAGPVLISDSMTRDRWAALAQI